MAEFHSKVKDAKSETDSVFSTSVNHSCVSHNLDRSIRLIETTFQLEAELRVSI